MCALSLLCASAASCSDATNTPASMASDEAPITASRDAGKHVDARSAAPVSHSDSDSDSSDTSTDAGLRRADGGAQLDAAVSSATAATDARTGAGDAAATGSDANPASYAAMLDALFIDVPCDKSTPTPLAKMATCLHPGTTQHIDRSVTFGGEPGAVYDVKLRVRGIWEPTFIQGGKRPYGKLPFTVGGTVEGGSGSSNDAINYQQYFIKVSDPAQTYWLNDYQYVAHDIHKEDYEATLRVAAGAHVTVSMNDGNDHEIANWTKDFFMGLSPYGDAPSTGQSLRLDVLSVSPASTTSP